MKVETKFSIGDEVYLIHARWNDVVYACRTCEGKGTLKVEGKRLKVTCPKCCGNGKRPTSRRKPFVAGPFKIDAVYVEALWERRGAVAVKRKADCGEFYASKAFSRRPPEDLYASKADALRELKRTKEEAAKMATKGKKK